jgi:glycosyltransferase A (GT-A) superfamily protein (DUF2064 family)
MTAAAIFVKTPGHSPLKTRLAVSLGEQATERLYLRCASAVAAAARRAGLSAVYWATAESAQAVSEDWPGLPHVEQGEGSLGERMHRVLAMLVGRHGAGLLLGADAPQVDPAQLRRAADWLDGRAARRVIGPAHDGGFWTFGANDLPERSLWTTVPYSQADTLHYFRKAMSGTADWLELPVLTDLDTVEDLPSVIEELKALPDPLPEQAALTRTILDQHPASRKA